LIVVDIAIMFLPFKNISKRGSLFAVGVCVVLSGVLIKLDQLEKAEPERFGKEVDKPWRKRQSD